MIKIEITDVTLEDAAQLRALAQYFEEAANAREAELDVSENSYDVEERPVAGVDKGDGYLEDISRRLRGSVASKLDNLMSEALGGPTPDEVLETAAIVGGMSKDGIQDAFNKTAKEAGVFGPTSSGGTSEGNCKTEVVGDIIEVIEITEPETVKVNTPPPPPQLVDSAGEVWDPKKHTRTKSRYVDGRWKPLRANTPVLKDNITPMTTRAAVVEATFEGVMGFVQSQVEQRKLKPEQVFHTVQQYGVNSLIELRDHPDIIPQVLASLQAIVIGGE